MEYNSSDSDELRGCGDDILAPNQEDELSFLKDMQQCINNNLSKSTLDVINDRLSPDSFDYDIDELIELLKDATDQDLYDMLSEPEQPEIEPEELEHITENWI